ncbi:hypothetical protein HDG69_003197 [Isoptericola halotolerans]|uniref:Uncharacterized protein n=1 Tax=Isoptericola halotolerans TaxID=300560 RepID=A0ABX2A6W5_9MICO|nr:hypothetical protein [Isoptericola halotolerans]
MSSSCRSSEPCAYFPGGVVTLRHQFELDAGRVTRLAIEV